ncbi:MAG: hypothetical protein SGPRY_005999 [Prymnesium sp.]
MRVRVSLHACSSGVALTLITWGPAPPSVRVTLSLRHDSSVSLSFLLTERLVRRQRRSDRGRHARGCGGLVCFDLSFGERMTSAETTALARQLALCYSFNRRLAAPFRLAFAGLQSKGATGVRDALEMWNWGDWAVEREGEGAIAASARGAFGDRHLVYLTSDSPDVLATVDLNAVYVIGGLVDHKPKEGAVMQHASDRKATTACLPLHPYLKLRKPALTCNAVMQILAGYVETGSWERAVRNATAMHQAPLKKYLRRKANSQTAKRVSKKPRFRHFPDDFAHPLGERAN